MKITTKASRYEIIMQKLLLCSLVGLMMVMISGCELTGKNSEENICAFMEQIAADTEKSIANKDAQLARNVWSDLTEEGLYAENQGASEVGKAVGGLAATYASLVSYCEKGDEALLNKFLDDFQTQSANLSQKIADEGFDTSVLEEYIAQICALE